MASHGHHHQHYTVPIGGAPFIHPQLSQLSTSPPSMPSSSFASTGSPSSSSSLASSPSSARSTGSSDSTSSSPWSEGHHQQLSSPVPEAALAYSRQLHRHTASMWESERLNIEKSRLEKARNRQQAGSSSPPTKSPRASMSAQGGGAQGGDSRDAASSTSSGGYRTLDFLLGRSRSKKEAPSSARLSGSGSTSGHRRNRSVV